MRYIVLFILFSVVSCAGEKSNNPLPAGISQKCPFYPNGEVVPGSGGLLCKIKTKDSTVADTVVAKHNDHVDVTAIIAQ